jgi:PAS domain S-box-containing protein
MPDKLCILTCANFEPELRSVLNLEEFDDVTTVCFPSACGRPPMTWENIGQIIRNLGDFAKVHVLGCCCLGEMVDPPEALAHTVIHRMGQCFDLVASPVFTDVYLRSGHYILTSGQALRWRQWLDSLGLDKETARQMFGESISNLLLLDTGVSVQAREELERFADFVGLPFEIIQIGLDFCRLFISRIVLEYRLEIQKKISDQVLRRTSSEKANYAMALDLLSGLTPGMTETDVVEKVTDLMKTLFAARTVNYLELTGQEGAGWISFLISSHPEAVNIDSPGSDEYSWTASGNGFSIPIKGRDTHVGILTVDDIAFPEHKERYLNLALQVSGVFALAVENARTYRQMTLTQNQLQESEEKFRGIFNNAGIGMFRSRLDGSETLEVNDKFLKILNRTREEVIGKPSVTLWVDPHEREEMVRRINTDGRVTDFEYRMLTAEGEERKCLTSLILYPDQGTVEGSIIDITERKRLEQEKEKLIVELQKALSEVKQLSRFLPICSSCKKIRDDTGYWQQIEEYISDHSEAQFSHGICPDCMRKLYPEYADEVLGRLKKDEKK